MICPRCGADTRVIETRAVKRKPVLQRRRACTSCPHRFTTYESREKPSILTVPSKEQRRERQAAYRARHPDRYCAQNKRAVQRRQAREQSVRTGEDLQALYRDWDVA